MEDFCPEHEYMDFDYEYVDDTLHQTPDERKKLIRAQSDIVRNNTNNGTLDFLTIKSRATGSSFQRASKDGCLDPNDFMCPFNKFRGSSINLEEEEEDHLWNFLNSTRSETNNMSSSNNSTVKGDFHQNKASSSTSSVNNSGRVFSSNNTEKGLDINDEPSSYSGAVLSGTQEGSKTKLFTIHKVNKKTHRKIITNCSHVNAQYYAKGMCKN